MSVAVLTVAALLTAMLSGMAGLGGGTILIALLFASGMTPALALPLHAGVQLASNGSRSVVYISHVQWSALGLFLIAAIPGPFLVAPLVVDANPDWIRLVMAVFVALAAWPAWAQRLRLHGRGGLLVAGLITGLMGPLIGATGLLAAPFFLRNDWRKESVIATMAAAQLCGHALKIAAFSANGFNVLARLDLLVPMVIAAIVGTVIGRQFLGSFSEGVFASCSASYWSCWLRSSPGTVCADCSGAKRSPQKSPKREGVLSISAAPRCNPKSCQKRRAAPALAIPGSSRATPYGGILGRNPSGRWPFFCNTALQLAHVARYTTFAAPCLAKARIYSGGRRRGVALIDNTPWGESMSLYAPTDVEAIIRRNVGAATQPHFEVCAIGDQQADVRLPYAPGMTRLGDTISGPVLMLAADAAMYAAIVAHVPDGEYAVTSHFHIDFLRRPRAADVLARAYILRVGRRSVTCRVELFSDNFDTIVAHVSGAYARMSSATSGATSGV